MIPRHQVRNPRPAIGVPFANSRQAYPPRNESGTMRWMGFCDPGQDPMPDMDPIPLIIENPSGNRGTGSTAGKPSAPPSSPKKKPRS